MVPRGARSCRAEGGLRGGHAAPGPDYAPEQADHRGLLPHCSCGNFRICAPEKPSKIRSTQPNLKLCCAQLQKLKVDTEAAMLELDQIMRQNELTIAVVAALPALAVAGFALAALRAWLTPSPPDPRWEALPARCPLLIPNHSGEFHVTIKPPSSTVQLQLRVCLNNGHSRADRARTRITLSPPNLRWEAPPSW